MGPVERKSYTQGIEREIPPVNPDDDPTIVTTTLTEPSNTFELVGSGYFGLAKPRDRRGRGLQPR